MKFKKITAALLTAAVMSSFAPMTFADADWYTYDYTTRKATLNEIVVPGDINVKEAGADDSTYADSKSVKFEANERKFDFKATLDMEPVSEKLKASIEVAEGLGKYDELKDREVTGEFTVTVIPGIYIEIPDADKNGSDMYGFITTSSIYEEISREVVDGNLVIKIGLKAGTSVEDLKKDGLADISYESKNVAVTKAGAINIYGTVKGYIETVNDENDNDVATTPELSVRADFVAKENDDEKICATIYSKSNTGGLGGGTATVSKKKATVTFLDGTKEYLKESVDITDGAYVFDVSAVAVPEAEANKIFTGWYKDKDCTVKASAKEEISADTKFYAGWFDTKYNVTYIVDNKTASVNTGTTGSVEVGSDAFTVTDEGVTIDLSKVKVIGANILGWYMDADYEEPAENIVTITEDTTFYATTKAIEVPPALENEKHIAYIQGYPDGTVKPEASITREEAAAIFFRILTDESRNANMTEENNFSDVEASRWSNTAISTMVKLGIINGYEDGSFKPANAITRAEFAAMVSRFFENELTAGLVSFTDISEHWAEEYIVKVAVMQWINGYEDGSFRPDYNITRAEAMAIINRILKRDVSSEYILDTAVYWDDNPKSAWYYEDVMEATNAHEYERLSADGVEERWTEIVADVTVW